MCALHPQSATSLQVRCGATMTAAIALFVAVAAAMVLAALGAATTTTAAVNCGAGVDASEVRLAALLPLHVGPNCSQANVRGAQQAAAVSAAAVRADTDLRTDGLTLGLRILDTCDSVDEVTKSTMRALVAAGQTCHKPPLFLGFIGPEDTKLVMEARRVSSVFGAVHVVPWLPNESPDIGNEVLPVVRENPTERAQTLETVLRKFRWRLFLLVRADDPWSISVTKELISILGSPSNRDICVGVGPQVISNSDVDSAATRVFREQDRHSGVLVISAKPKLAGSFLRKLSKLPEDTPGSHHVMIAVRDVGLSAQHVSTRGPTTVVQFTSPKAALHPGHREALLDSSVWAEIVRTIAPEKDTEFTALKADAQDPSVAPLAFSVHLLAAAAKIAQERSCGESARGACDELLHTSPEDWRAIVGQTASTSPTADGANRKVRFSMDFVGAAKLFFRPAGGDEFDPVGTLTGGRSLHLDNFHPPDPPTTECATARTKKPTTTTRSKKTVRTTSKTKPTPTYNPDDSETSNGRGLGGIDWAWLFRSSDDSDDVSAIFNQTLYMITAAGVAMLLVFSLCICIVYRSFRVRSSRSSSSDDSSTRSKASAHS